MLLDGASVRGRVLDTEAFATAAAIAQKKAEMDNFVETYKNPLINILLTYSEILPLGLIASLITALILKRKRPVDNLVVRGQGI